MRERTKVNETHTPSVGATNENVPFVRMHAGRPTDRVEGMNQNYLKGYKCFSKTQNRERIKKNSPLFIQMACIEFLSWHCSRTFDLILLTCFEKSSVLFVFFFFWNKTQKCVRVMITMNGLVPITNKIIRSKQQQTRCVAIAYHIRMNWLNAKFYFIRFNLRIFCAFFSFSLAPSLCFMQKKNAKWLCFVGFPLYSIFDYFLALLFRWWCFCCWSSFFSHFWFWLARMFAVTLIA